MKQRKCSVSCLREAVSLPNHMRRVKVLINGVSGRVGFSTDTYE